MSVSNSIARVRLCAASLLAAAAATTSCGQVTDLDPGRESADLAASLSRVIGTGSGRCIDPRGTLADGTRAVIEDCDTLAAQQWRVGAVGTSGPIVHSSGRCLDASGGSSADGTVVQLWTCNGTNAQVWTRTSSGELLGPGGKCLDVNGEATANGSVLQLWTCHGSSNQTWRTDVPVVADAGVHDAGTDAAHDAATDAGTTSTLVGTVRMLHRVSGTDDSYLTGANGSDTAARAWLQAHWQGYEGFGGGPTPAATHWLPGGLYYWDTTAVNTTTSPPTQYIMRRPSTGELCYNPWGGNPNPQYAWDIYSETTRQYLIGQMRTAIASGAWHGFWLDDINLDIESSCVGPYDETWYTEFGNDQAASDRWADAVATFVEEIRAAFPTLFLLHNAPWFSRGPARWTDPYVQREIRAANVLNREGGALDDGLGTGTTASNYWSLDAVFSYADALHAAGRGIVWDSFPNGDATQRKYALAAYLIALGPGDYYGDDSARTPATWPALYGLNLGAPTGARSFDGDAVFTRAFAHGTVTLNVRTHTATIPGY